ncbi:amidohydrolase family protein [Saccharopolyspora taberi]|uniref:Amidohydrolase family protein n=1 Tax=Saccharopolyspora taberi TaxID=60895 RepID=A0ABN3VJG1_9PSEU
MRIDVHHHVIPPAWSSALAGRGLLTGGIAVPDWSLRAARDLMEAQRISSAVLSVSAPGVHLGDDAEARRLAREVNEYSAEIVKDDPRRFGFFASAPLPDVDGAVAEAVHALDELGADGVVLLGNARGRYLGDPGFDPLWAELDRRRAVVFVHPTDLPGTGPGDGAFAAHADFLLDTTRSVLSMIRSGIPTRYPQVKIVLSHAGGFVPYAAHRIAAGFAMQDKDLGVLTDVLEQLRGFYFDVALSAPSALPSLLAFARPEHVLYGSDWPMNPAVGVGYFTGNLESHALDPELREAIDFRNALSLFPRFAE